MAAWQQDKLSRAIQIAITTITKLTKLTNRGSNVVAGTDPMVIVRVTITIRTRTPTRRIGILAAPREHHSSRPLE